MYTERQALDLIRATATRSVPNCINLTAIDRILADVGQPDVLDIARIKRVLKTLRFQDRASLCDDLKVHFSYLEAVLIQPGDQQSSFTADTFKQLVERAASRWPSLAKQMGLQAPHDTVGEQAPAMLSVLQGMNKQ